MTSYDLAEAMEGMSPEQLGTSLYPEGDYTFVVVSAKEGQTSNNNPKISVRAEFVGAPFEGSQEFFDIILSTKSIQAQRMFYRRLKALGVGDIEVKQLRTFDRICQYIEGVHFTGTITHEEFRGEKSARINPKTFLSNPSTPRPTPSPEGMNEFVNGTGSPLDDIDIETTEQSNAAPAVQDAKPEVQDALAGDDSSEDPWA